MSRNKSYNGMTLLVALLSLIIGVGAVGCQQTPPTLDLPPAPAGRR